MKRRFVIFALLALASGVSATCSARAVNLSDEMATVFEGLRGLNGELSKLPSVERAALIGKARPRLYQAVTYFLRKMGRLSPRETVERVEIFFGSVENVTNRDCQGLTLAGYNDELLAKVYLKGGRAEDALLRCLNLRLLIPENVDTLQKLASVKVEHETSEVFIDNNQSLTQFVDYSVAVDLAERHSLTIYRGKQKITPEIARRLESLIDQSQVTVGVMQGDHFDLLLGRYNRSPIRILKKK